MPTTIFTFILLHVVNLQLLNNTYFIFENEYILTNWPTISIPYDIDKSKQQRTLSLVQEYNLTEEYKQPISPQIKLYSLIKSNNQDIDIVQLEDQKLSFLYKIKNYLSNNQLLIQPNNYSILLTQQSYFSLHYLNSESYILICKMKEPKIIIQILDLNQQSSEQDFTIKNLTFLDYNPNCQINTSYMFSILVIFETNCSDSKFETYLIDTNQYKILNQTNFTMNQYNKSNEFITSIEICSPSILRILTNTTQLMVHLQYPEFSIYQAVSEATFSNADINICTMESLSFKLRANNSQLIFNDNSLNVSSENFINAFLVNKLIVLHKKDHVIVYFDQDLQIIIRQSFQQLFTLSNLPYIIGVTEDGSLIAYRIRIPRLCFTYSNSSKIQILQYSRSIRFYNQITVSKVLDIHLMSEKSPKLLISENKEFFLLFKGSRIVFSLSNIQKSLPLQLKQIYANGKLINFIEETQKLHCHIDISNLKQLLFIRLEDDSHLVLFNQNNATKLIVAICTEEKLSIIKQIKLSYGLIKIIIFNDVSCFCVVQQNQLSIYNYESFQLQDRSYNLNLTVIDAFIKGNTGLICLVFIDCTQRCYVINQNEEKPLQYLQSLELKCNRNKQLITELFFIDEHELFFKSKVSYQEQLILEVTIIKAEVMLQQSKILLFTTYDNEKLKIKLFSFLNDELQFIYDCPLYCFSLTIPLIYRLKGNFLLILAENLFFSPVILVYNLGNSAVTSLIQVIEIDKEHLHFDFIFGSGKAFYFIYQNVIQIRELDVFSIIFDNQIVSFNAFNKFDFQFNFEDPIQSEIISNNQSYRYFNDDYQIKLIQRNTLNLDSKQVLDMSNVFSNIIQIEVIPHNYYLIIPPITVTPDKIICQFYSNKCCITQFEIICWIKNQMFIQKIHHLIQQVFIIDCNDNQYECTIIYNLNGFIHLMIVQFKKNQLFQETLKTQQGSNQNVPFHHVSDLDIRFQDQEIVIFSSEQSNAIYILLRYQIIQQINYNFSKLQNAFLQIRRINNENCILLYENKQEILYSIINISHNNISEQQEIVQLNLIQNQTCFSIYDIIGKLQGVSIKLKMIHIIESNLVQDILIIELLALFEQQFGIVLQLKIDIIKQEKCNFEILQTLRYPINSTINRILYVDKEYIIISVTQLKYQNIILYDRFLDQNISFIHSIYTLPDDNYSKIEYFNNSHFSLIKQIDQIQEVYFISISRYKLECLNECDSLATLILKNEVSNFTITLQNINIQIPFYHNMTLIITIINLLSIQIFVQFRKKQ